MWLSCGHKAAVGRGGWALERPYFAKAGSAFVCRACEYAVMLAAGAGGESSLCSSSHTRGIYAEEGSAGELLHALSFSGTSLFVEEFAAGEPCSRACACAMCLHHVAP